MFPIWSQRNGFYPNDLPELGVARRRQNSKNGASAIRPEIR
jgi:hypothetical protein